MSQRAERELKRVRRKLKKKNLKAVNVEAAGKSIRLSGSAGNWDERVRAGYIAAGHGFKGVINDITVDGITEPEMSLPLVSDEMLDGREFDAVIVGGGVVGCAIARELSKMNISIVILEKEADLAMQASGRNDGMIHPGFAASPGTKKAHYNIRGNRMYTELSKQLDFELKRPGSIILFKTAWYKLLLPIFKARCRKNGVEGSWRSLSAKEVRRVEPNVSPSQKGGFILPSAGIVSPYRVTIALAENAVENGAEVFLNTVVRDLESADGKITGVVTNRGTLRCGLVINAAGVWADKLAEMAGDRFFSIHGRKGTDAILDRSCAPLQRHIVGMPSLLGTKNSHSKGGGIVLCVEGNILLGPTAEEVPDREDYSTEPESFNNLLKQLYLNTRLNSSMIINYYSGVRAASWDEDFIIEPSEKVSNLIHVAAIQSPGLASAPAIAEDVAQMAVRALTSAGVRVLPRADFNPIRRGIPAVKDLTAEARTALIKEDPAYGEILCRCEEVSRGEIRDALLSKVPATTIDGVKRRVRAGAGRCHGGFCLPRVIQAMASELGVQVTDITKKGGDSAILIGETKEEAAREAAV
ncbi:MAG: NAD(P)/FAD-dependent oxidoreductase [Spirochaetales bacterium]|nr:NAD(P)/FAD-dependent oxidoreductase [Spirochaetales bacterium]